jgi:cytosine/adenosine deaminase-related metal-dependent hydrolase
MNHPLPPRTLLRAAAIADGRSIRAAPGCILLEDRRILAAGPPVQIGPVAGAAILDHPGSVLVPALVNSHAHLDLTHLGPWPYAGDFCGWIEMVRLRRAADDGGIRSSVARGVALSLRGGTGLIGDIAGAGSITAVEALRASGLGGVSFVELFGTGAREAAAIAALHGLSTRAPRDDRGVRLGVQPHAPYSAGNALYSAAAAAGLPVATHMAETLAELAFFRDASGPLASFLQRLGALNAEFRGTGSHPIDALAPALQRAPWLLAHCNYLDRSHLALLAQWNTSIAYCPRAASYFGHPHEGRPPHAYRDMLDAGVNVALGTDSIACLDTPDRLSILDEMRFLHARDGTNPILLLRMATVNGARALGFDSDAFTLRAGPSAGLLAVTPGAACSEADPLRAILAGPPPTIEWILPPLAPPGAGDAFPQRCGQ